MRYVDELIGAAVAWSVIFVVGRAGERLLFANAKSLRPLTLLEAATVSAIALIALVVIGQVRRIAFVIAPKLLLVMTILCIVQWLWLFRISPWWIADEARVAFAARHPFVMLIIEIGLPAFAGGITWVALMHAVTRRRRIVVVVASFVACAVTASVISPEVIRGTFELAGWVGLASPRHLSGTHTNPLPRNFAYVVVAALTGLILYVTARPGSRDHALTE